MPKICICADDYAISPGVSRGICELLEQQRITAVSVITASDHWPDTSQALLPYRATVDIGLHITLTMLKPLGAMPKFAPDNKFPKLGAVLQAAYLRKLPYHEIKAEIERQLQRFYLYFGSWPSHIDGHQHVHILPGIREIILQIFLKLLADDQRYIRNCVADLRQVFKQTSPIKALGISALAYRAKLQLQHYKVPTNVGFAGVYDFADNMDHAGMLQKFIAGAKDRLLIMSHPGYVDPELQAVDPIWQPREAELKFLLSDQCRELFSQNQVQLQPFSQI